MSIFNLFIHVLQVPLGHWKKCVEKVEEKILCTGSGENSSQIIQSLQQ